MANAEILPYLPRTQGVQGGELRPHGERSDIERALQGLPVASEKLQKDGAKK